jgi:hypothetical protein
VKSEENQIETLTLGLGAYLITVVPDPCSSPMSGSRKRGHDHRTAGHGRRQCATGVDIVVSAARCHPCTLEIDRGRHLLAQAVGHT